MLCYMVEKEWHIQISYGMSWDKVKVQFWMSVY
jgi:hypothetical protein